MIFDQKKGTFLFVEQNTQIMQHALIVNLQDRDMICPSMPLRVVLQTNNYIKTTKKRCL